MAKKQKTKKQRHMNDHYATEPWIAAWGVDRCLEILKRNKGETDPSKMTMMEPGSGLTAPFSKRAANIGIDSYGLDIMNFGNPLLDWNAVQRKPDPNLHIFGDVNFLDRKQYPLDPDHRFDIIATNPAFFLGWDFVAESLRYLKPRGVLCILQKMSFVATPDRYAEMQKRMPIEQCPMATKRLSFTGDGRTDSQEYALYFWGSSEIERKFRKRNGPGFMCRPQDNRAMIERWDNGWDK